MCFGGPDRFLNPLEVGLVLMAWHNGTVTCFFPCCHTYTTLTWLLFFPMPALPSYLLLPCLPCGAVLCVFCSLSSLSPLSPLLLILYMPSLPSTNNNNILHARTLPGIVLILPPYHPWLAAFLPSLHTERRGWEGEGGKIEAVNFGRSGGRGTPVQW